MNTQFKPHATAEVQTRISAVSQLTDDQRDMVRFAAFEALKEIVQREERDGNLSRLGLLFSNNNWEINRQIVDDITARCVLKLKDKVKIPILLKRKMSRDSVEGVIQHIQKSYKCNSLSKLVRYFSYTQLKTPSQISFYH